MLRYFRAFLNTWAARAFFAVLVVAFGLWGIGDVLRNAGSDTALAKVGDRRIEPAEFQQAFRRDLAQLQRMMGSAEPPPALRRTVAEQTLDRLVVQAAVADEVNRLGIVVPDAQLRQAVFAMPIFRGPSGSFDRATFEAIMRNNSLTEPQFLDMMRADLAQRQLLQTVQAGIAAPTTLIDAAYAFQRETRSGEVVELPIEAATAPPEPTADDLQRQYENNPASYTAPAFRRIKLVVLSPQTLARGIEVPDDDIKAYYEQHKSDYVSEEQRAAQVIVASDEAVAQKLEAAWKGGADWAAMQKEAQAAGASAIAVDLSTKSQYPSPDLAAAVFAAGPDAVTGPIKSPFGYQLVKVTKVEAGSSKTLDQAKDEIKQKLAMDRAVDQVYTRANKLDDALSAGTSLDDLPGDLGLAAVTGTLDAQGNTPEGEPAPIPGTKALRDAILKAAFSTSTGDTPRMLEGPDQSYYALHVEEIIEPKLKPFDEVKTQVREDWLEAQRRHEAEASAAKLMQAAQASGSLDDAATVAGLRMDKTPAVERSAPAEDVVPQVQAALFQLQKGETTMVETPTGFAVVRLAAINEPDPAKDPAGFAQVRESMTNALDQDVQIVFASALRDRAQPRVNRTLLDNLVE